MEAKETIFDRIEQSFELFKDNFLKLLLPIFTYTFLTVTIFISVVSFFLMKYSHKLGEILLAKSDIERLSFLNYGPEIMIGIIIFVVLVILYLTIYIPFLLATIKGIKQAYNKEEITIKENIIYGFKNIFKSFQTYWYIFAYVALIPAIILIIGGILAIYGLEYHNENYTQTGSLIAGLALFIFIVFAIYRGLKSEFAIYSAIDKNSYTKQNFINSVNVTDNNWWRIFGNFLLIGIIIGLVSGIFTNTINSIIPSSFDTSSLGLQDMINAKENGKFDINTLNNLLDSYSPFYNFLSNAINQIISSIISVFMMIFTYIFFKRLEIENNKNSEIEKIEL